MIMNVKYSHNVYAGNQLCVSERKSLYTLYLYSLILVYIITSNTSVKYTLHSLFQDVNAWPNLKKGTIRKS